MTSATPTPTDATKPQSGEAAHTTTSPAMEPDAFRCGTIAIVGRPNVGKSTLLNALIGQKISITSRKAQTTRHRITGIQTTDNAQYVFIDTPGFQTRHASALNRSLNRAVTSTLANVDLVLFVVEAGYYSAEDDKVRSLLPSNVPVILLTNKLDTVGESRTEVMMPFLERVGAEHPFAEVMPLSAKNKEHIQRLLTLVRPYLPAGAAMYGADELTDRSERFMAAEIIREKVFRWTGDELPYTSTVIIDKFEIEGRLRRIFATILVEKDTHKAMIIGAKGAKLKTISTEARQDMEVLFDGKVYLEVWIKIKSGWADNEAGLRAYGYE